MERYGPREAVAVASGMQQYAFESSRPITHAAPKPLARPGDFILTHSSGVVGGLIRFGEWLRYWGADKIYAHWSHAAIFVDDSGNIIEAINAGVQKRNISVYQDTEYVVVHLPEDTADADRQQAVKFAEYSVNEPYAWLTIVGIGLSLLTGAKFGFGIDGQQICSALVARCIERTGEIFAENEPWHLMPADLAKHFNVGLTGMKGNVPASNAGVVAFSRPGKSKSR
jgi:uncharacterized protein YycO